MARTAALLGLAWAATTMASQPVTVLELFTSQGCSSCPPADAAFQALAARGDLPEGVVALAYHVDYWDYLGWKDPYSDARWSDRQRRYARFLGESRIYTPQLVVNGAAHRVGPGDVATLDQIAKRAALTPPGALTVSAQRQGSKLAATASLALDAPFAAARRAGLRLVLYQNAPATAVPAGENTGRKLVNAWVVRDFAAGTVVEKGAQGTIQARHVFTPPSGGGFGVVALLEDEATGKVLHAARAGGE